MKTLTAGLTLTLLILTLSACGIMGSTDRCEELGATDRQCRLIEDGFIEVGMTDAMVRESWGEPNVADDCPHEESNVNTLIWSYRGPLSYNLDIDNNSCRVTKIMECENNWNHICHDAGNTAP